jgi:hypothetical protein
VTLLLLERFREAAKERGGCVSKAKDRKGHQLDSEEFVIGEKMEKDTTARFIDEGGGRGHRGAGLMGSGKSQVGGATWFEIVKVACGPLCNRRVKVQ